MRLIDLLDTIDSLDEGSTVYAVEPWTPDSMVLVDVEPDEGGLPESAQRLGMTYFLEVALIHELIRGWEETCASGPTLKEKCSKLIQYAIHDA